MTCHDCHLQAAPDKILCRRCLARNRHLMDRLENAPRVRAPGFDPQEDPTATALERVLDPFIVSGERPRLTREDRAALWADHVETMQRRRQAAGEVC